MDYCICGDDRFEIIAKAKERLMEATNIESRPDEMAVLDSMLFRFWQMGWLPRTCESCAVPERDFGHAPYPCFDCCRNDARPDRYEPKVVG